MYLMFCLAGFDAYSLGRVVGVHCHGFPMSNEGLPRLQHKACEHLGYNLIGCLGTMRLEAGAVDLLHQLLEGEADLGDCGLEVGVLGRALQRQQAALDAEALVCVTRCRRSVQLFLAEDEVAKQAGARVCLDLVHLVFGCTSC